MMTALDKIKLAPIFLIIQILWLVDDIGNVTKKSISNIFRLSLYLVVVTVALSGFYVSAKNSGITNIPSVLNPETPGVLGVVIAKEPVLSIESPPPEISAVSVYAVDLDSGKVLLDLNSNFELAPASTTKLITALVALDLYSLDENIKVPEFCTQIEGLKAGFYADDTYSIRDLLFSLLVNSSADAACSLSVGKVPYVDFISLMNTKAEILGLSNSNFSNPIGLDGENGSNYSSAKDLYLLGRSARENELIKEIIKTKEVTIVSGSGFPTSLVNTNDLLWVQPGSVGIKTGQTQAAGQVLLYEYDLNGRNIIISLMHSSDRFGDTLRVLDWILNSYSWPD